MTNHARGPSLLQARNELNHRHLHSQPLARKPLHDANVNGAGNHVRSPPRDQQLHGRQVVVVQTVSVLHIIDETGAVIGSSTLLPKPATQLLDVPAALTAGLSELDNLLPTPTLPDDVLPLSETPAPAGSSILSSLTDTETLTSDPSSESTTFPTLSRVFNSTRTPGFFGNGTFLFSNTTRTRTSSSESSSTTSDSSTLTSVFIIPTEVVGGNGNVPPPPPAPPSPTSKAAAAPSPGLTPAAQSAVIGGVVGSVAGVALVALFLMFLLKWKKGHQNGLLLLGDGDSTKRGGGLGLSPGPKPRGGGGGGMTERSVPFAVPSALASLTGQRKVIEAGPGEADVEEKGFYRVSGKKLVSVLQSGGDGYSDPHASVMSGHSDYRTSEAFFGGPLQRLQLGSPMRPESGVMIMRSGPNRTPVQEQNPFSDEPRPLTPPTVNPYGRSLTSLAASGSRGSNTRFAEDM